MAVVTVFCLGCVTVLCVCTMPCMHIISVHVVLRERERMYDVIMSVYIRVCACVVSVCVSVCVYISALLVCDGA